MTELNRLLALERMRTVLEWLKPGELVVVALRLEYEMSYAEIGDELGITKAAAASRLYTAQQRLAREMPELVRHNGHGRSNGHLWAERGLAFLRAVSDIEARGGVPSLPVIECETGWPNHTAYRVWARVRDNGWAVQGSRLGNTRPVELTAAGREVLEAS